MMPKTDYTEVKRQLDRIDELASVEMRALEQKTRRIAARQGLGLSKSRTRVWEAGDYDRWFIFDRDTNYVVYGAETGRHCATLPEVIQYLIA
jgi:hypothetical protein